VKCTVPASPQFLAASSAVASHAQYAAHCLASNLDATPQFFNGPENYFTVAFNLRNTSDHPCVIDGPGRTVYNAGLVYRGSAFKFCCGCDRVLSNGQPGLTGRR
jgi:hypothetical protein